MKNKIVWFLVGCIGLGCSLAGCGSNKKEASDKVIIWHWMSDRDEVFNQLACLFEKETGIKVKFELYAPSEPYASKVMAAAQTNTLPDIFGVLGETKNFASFIEAGLIYNLRDEMEKNNGEWKKIFFERALASNIFGEDNQYHVPAGIYGVPIDVSNVQMLYNKKLFRIAGLNPDKPPKTWAEFMHCIDALNAKGMSPFVSGWGETWLIECFANNYAFNIMGEKKIMDTYAGTVPYTDPDWINVLSLFKEMVDRKALLPGTVTMVNKVAEQNFALERAAFTFNGSWSVNVFSGMNPSLEYAVMMPPKVSDAYPMKIWGWGGSSLVINYKSERKKECIEFLHWLTSKDVQSDLARKTINLPSNKNSLGNIDLVLAQFASHMDYATHPSNWPVREDARITKAFDKGVQSILIGEKTPEQVAEEVQKEKNLYQNRSK